MKLWTSPWVSCLVILILCFGSECGTVERRKGRSKRDLVRMRETRATLPGACATRLPRGKRSLAGLERRGLRQRRRSSSQPEASSPERGKAVYFTGRGDQLRLKPGVEIPRGNFTLEMWIKPEGGQRSPTVIAGLYDKCFYASSDRGWLLGIQSVSEHGNRDPRFFFSLKTDRAHKATTIHSNAHYAPNQWAYLAVTYDGIYMKLFVNGAQVGVSREQSGDVFSHLTKKCKVLMIGGNALNHNYRGAVERVALWRHARGQRQIIKDMRGNEDPQDLPQLVIRETFEHPARKWLTVKDGSFPQPEERGSGRTGFQVAGGNVEGLLDTTLEPPACGQTVCDNVEVIKNYNQLSSFRRPKKVRYRVINIWDDTQTKPTVSDHQISLQHQRLNDAFNPYNISWELSIHNITNSSLRNRLILANCDISKVGDDACDPECNHPLTGFDAGDCVSGHRSRCPESKQGNGVCDPECNWENFSYDLGDCCDPDVTDVTKTCFNRSSPHKAYLDVKELKEILRLDGSTHLNVFFANSSDEDLAGVATWPWDKEALTHLGGIVLNPSFYGTFGHTDTMVHEVGHSLGLYHVFRGISEIESCNDACLETEPSMETGDLCADTNPTPKFKGCHDPEPGNETCGSPHFTQTPFNNYMSYADDSCTDSFTLNQVARMHCYLDLVYQTWQPASKPPPVPMPPQVVEQHHKSVTLEWFPPISGHFYDRELGSVCDKCTEGGVLLQYASNSSSPRPCAPSGHWSPLEAEGPPDVEQACEPSVRTWSPNSGNEQGNVGFSECPLQGCMLQLEFLHPLVPDSLTVWVTFFSLEETALPAIHNILLLTVNGNNISLGPSNVFCDTALTLKLDVEEEIYGVQFFTMEQNLEIDATLLASKPDCSLCDDCQPLRYRLLRQPAFTHAPHGLIFNEPSRRYTDRDVDPHVTYTYRVQTISSRSESEPSPPLVHELGATYCGDGQIQSSKGEECDDMNSMNGDGCSSQCKKEPFFNCVEEPSMCYYYDGDGVCEDFERETGVRDCGLYTPSGFLDQWASAVEVSHEKKPYCSGEVAAGYPAVTKTCQSKVFDLSDGVSQYAWFPCHEARKTPWGIYWLKAHFSHPMVAAAVIIHLAADGTGYIDQTQCNITVQLVDTKEGIHSLGEWRLSCRTNPLVIPVSHDLSVAFYHTTAILVTFASRLVAISGVGLRSFQSFDPITISGCQSNEIYNPTGQSCVHYSCEAIDCQEPLIRNAELKCSNTGHHFYNGDRCTISCNSGYVLQIHQDDDIIKSQSHSLVTITCTNGKWNKQVSCEPVDCGLPDKYHVHPAHFQFPEGTTYGKKSTFQCREPAQLVGTNNTLTCLEDGLWSFPEALCELRCPAPPPVPNAVLQTKRCNETGLKVGTLCKYKCRPGYHVTNKPKRRAFKRQCTEDGSWLEGACEPVTCEPPPPIFHGSYHCTDGFRFDSICRLNCSDQAGNSANAVNGGSAHTVRLLHAPCKQGVGSNAIRCRKDGNWTGSFRLCPTSKGQCSLPQNLHPDVQYSCRHGHGIGEECDLKCRKISDDVVILPSNMTVASVLEEHWRNPHKVKSIVCTMGLKWYPHPELLHCFKGCDPFMGDNYCDAVNNRAFCNYDGGDCCQSTVKTKKVIPFPMSCNIRDECSCRDPNATENKREENVLSLG
ncbi:pregnancy-associated plasma protein A, pappalysin 1a isoform X1 [Corythoichthys intestinalis]|uniref:pregnancy-associated plasma protein A, pappalysin 1a isoform X1 n=1 Tax=Corythoichthys intestinalis TaxID=161448 RepID=UPI0025A528CC|nr:pregnancy-associated plasma protein A, pappalysin 1a isoform X1 [Corythoichthys intestinalis]XP_061800345.1 pappalysin-1-like [Nerophis lumbriciformis]